MENFEEGLLGDPRNAHLASRLRLVLTDRDFDGNDYEELMALDVHARPVHPVATDSDIRRLPHHTMGAGDVQRELGRGKEVKRSSHRAALPACHLASPITWVLLRQVNRSTDSGLPRPPASLLLMASARALRVPCALKLGKKGTSSALCPASIACTWSECTH